MAGSDESGKSWPPPAGNHWRFGAQPSSDKDAPTHPRAALIGSEPGNMRSCGRKSDGTRAQLTPVGWPRVHWSGGRTRTSDAPCHVARTSADQVVVAAASGGRGRLQLACPPFRIPFRIPQHVEVAYWLPARAGSSIFPPVKSPAPRERNRLISRYRLFLFYSFPLLCSINLCVCGKKINLG